MLRSLIRLLSLVCFAVAIVAAILDVTRSIADSEVIMTPLIEDWNRISPQSLESAQSWVTETLTAFVWDPLLVSLLNLPSWSVFTAAALLLALATRRRRSRWQEKFGA